jgi:23S rRNA pseudouridine2605 synthase
MRLQRFLAMAGVASRRHAEEVITQGAVRVNNKVVRELGSKVDPERDKVTVSGRRVQPEEKVYLLLNKPQATVATLSDPQGRPHIGQLLPRRAGARLYPVGRLDWGTGGALLITNDGDLAQALLHPSKPIAKTYHIKVRGLVSPLTLEKMREGGIRALGGPTPPCQAAVVTTTGKNTWLEITMGERKAGQAAKMCEELGHLPLRVLRVAFAEIGIEGLPEGETRELTDQEIAELRRTAGVSKPKPMQARGRHKAERGGGAPPHRRPGQKPSRYR